MDELDAFEFVLAEQLHKTLTEVRAMPNTEYESFRAWYRVKAALREANGNR